MFSIILTVLLVVVIFFIIIAKDDKKKSSSTSRSAYSAHTYNDNYSLSDRNPKISAEVSDDLYNDVQSYCHENSMTISALIRESIRYYMDANSSRSSFYKKNENIPKNYWKCPKCGRNNPPYTGTCGCGNSKP